MRLDQIDLLEKCIEVADAGPWELRWRWAEAVRSKDYLTGPGGKLRYKMAAVLIKRAEAQGLALTLTEIGRRLELFKKAPTRPKLSQIVGEFKSYDEGQRNHFVPHVKTDPDPVPQPDQLDLFAAQTRALVAELEADERFACSIFDLCDPKPEYMWTAYVAGFDQKEAKAKDAWKEIVREKRFIDKVQDRVPDCNSMTFRDVMEAYKANKARRTPACKGE